MVSMASPPRQHAATQPVAAPAPSLSSSALMLSSASLRASFPPVATAANRYQYDHAVHAAHAGTQDYTFSASQLNVSSSASASASSMNTSAVFASGGGGDASAAGGARSMNPLRMSAEAVRLRALTAAVSGRVGALSTTATTTAATLGSASSAAAATRESLQDDAGLRDDNALSTAAQLEHETRRLMQQHQQRKQHEQQQQASRP